jgi:hypothetical protein
LHGDEWRFTGVLKEHEPHVAVVEAKRDRPPIRSPRERSEFRAQKKIGDYDGGTAVAHGERCPLARRGGDETAIGREGKDARHTSDSSRLGRWGSRRGVPNRKGAIGRGRRDPRAIGREGEGDLPREHLFRTGSHVPEPDTLARSDR